MRTLDDIYHLDGDHREILFEDGLWCLYRNNGNDRVPGREVFITHRCNRSKGAVATSLFLDGSYQTKPGGSITCGSGIVNSGCEVPVPDGLVALFILHKWER